MLCNSFTKLEAVESKSRSLWKQALNFREWIDSLNQQNLKKLKEAWQERRKLSVYKRNILVYTIDKIVSFRIFFKNFGHPGLFFIFFIIFITSIYQPCIPSGSFSKWPFVLLYRINMQIWYFHDQYKANSLGTNEILYIFYLCHMSKVAIHFQKKEKRFIYSTLLMFK